MKNNNITSEQEKVIDTIHNLVWHRITHEDHYLEAIPEIDSKGFRDWIYSVTYKFHEYDDSWVEAVVYLNGKHYEYCNTLQFLNSIWVNEIKESEVRDKIVEIGGFIDDHFEIYDSHKPLPEEGVAKLNALLNKKKAADEHDYDDLPF
ncbi:hypothetical protein [Carboxylicivirga sp. N1Y90]|uniref:hypothetical protein n=1 Tax=Carboxylicivirga fragile TaxID=3417571 RepID=UPI003D33BBB2|nr:hypothetical protein [Marinilabiliaceae bacterium N1Y90]